MMPSFKAGDNYILEDVTTHRCTCGAVVKFGYVKGSPSALHSMPTCQDYDRRDPVQFIEWLNLVARSGGTA